MKAPFKNCPKCTSAKLNFNISQFSCPKCNFIYFHNVAAAVCVLIEYKDYVLFTRRAKAPGKNLLDLPGGFIDPNESAENAAKREIKEELGFELPNLTYKASYPNQYRYKNITYNTCDIAFLCRLKSLPIIEKERQEIKQVIWLKISELKINEMAFSSIRNMLIAHYELET